MDTKTKILVLTLIAGSNIGWAIAYFKANTRAEMIMAVYMQIHGFDELLVRKIAEYDPDIFKDPEIQTKLTEMEFMDIVNNFETK